MKFNILDCHSYDKIIKRKSYDIMDFRIDPQSYKLKDIVHAFLKDKPSIFKIQSVVYDEYGMKKTDRKKIPVSFFMEITSGRCKARRCKCRLRSAC